MFDMIKAFKCKLILWEKQLKNEEYQKYAEKILELGTEFETRFKDDD